MAGKTWHAGCLSLTVIPDTLEIFRTENGPLKATATSSLESESVSTTLHLAANSSIETKAVVCSRDREGAEAFRVVAAIIGILVIVSGAALHSVAEPAHVQIPSPNPTPYGYTRSLLLFFLPVAVLAGWFIRRPDNRLARQSFWKTILLLVPSGFVLDLVFGNLFFQFPNFKATLGMGVPAMGGPIPVEEFMFYVGGFMLILLCYIWADEDWLSRYHVSPQGSQVKSLASLVQFHPSSLIVGSVLFGAAVAYKKLWAADAAGFPWYLTYLLLVGIVPSAAFFTAIRGAINWRAFSFTFLVILLVSVVWEVTLAIPYGWWGYRPEAMMGLKIRAWSDLPIEAIAVWLVVAFDTVIAYELIKLLDGQQRECTKRTAMTIDNPVRTITGTATFLCGAETMTA